MAKFMSDLENRTGDGQTQTGRDPSGGHGEAKRGILNRITAAKARKRDQQSEVDQRLRPVLSLLFLCTFIPHLYPREISWLSTIIENA
jgi:hypothetical protein